MKALWRRGTWNRGRKLTFVGLIATVALIVSAAIVASVSVTGGSTDHGVRTFAPGSAAVPGGSTGGGAASTSQPTANVSRKGKPIVPRAVKPKPGRIQSKPGAHGEGEPEVNETPPGIGGGVATKGRPAVISDHRASGKSSFLNSVLTANGSFANLASFTGATFAQTTCAQCGGEPPDSQTAVGTNEVVQAVNTHIFVYSRGGTKLTDFDALDLFGRDVNGNTNTNVGLADPKILFDPSSNRYYLTMMVCDAAFCGGNTWSSMGISLAVTSNPQGSWTVYDYINDGVDLQDQEKLGFSGDKITFAVNEYGCKCGAGASFKQENVVVIQKSEAVAGQTIDWVLYSDATNNSNSTYLFDSMPTTPLNSSTSDNTQYVVWDWRGSSNNFMKLIRITGTPNGNDLDFTGNVTKIGIANQTAPPAPVAKGGNLAGDKQNFQSAMVQGNELWTVATDGCTPQGDSTDRDCTRLVEVTLNNNSVAIDTDIGTNGTYRINPSVSKDTSGHVFFGFTISDSSTYATAALDASGLPLPSVLQRINFASGDAGYTGSRWGDYSGTQQDPSNTNDVWTSQEFGACNTGCSNAGGNNWADQEGQFTFRDPHITSISPTQGPPSGGTTVDIYGSEFANGGTTVKFGANTSSSVAWIDSTHIQAVSPAGNVGTVDVTAETGAGTSDTSSADEFTYRKFPTTTTYTGATSGDYNDVVTLKANLKNNDNSLGVAGKTISFSVGAESCNGTTNSSGDASCTVTLADLPGGSYMVQATFTGDVDYEASGASTPFTVNKEDTKLVYGGPLTAHYHDTISASATLTDKDDGTAIANKSVTFTLGADTCSANTNNSGVASCSITPSQVTATTISASYAGDSYFQSASDSQSFSITPEETTVKYTGPTVILAGALGATLKATLVEEGSNDADSDAGSIVPNPTETVKLSIGTQSCNATTTSLSGDVSCTISSVTVPLGNQTVGASFAGDSYYQASSDSKTATVFAFPNSGVFTLGDLTVAGAGSSTVTWWSNNWYLLDSLSGGQAPPPFKGFVGTVTLPNTTPANICSGNWSTTGGNSPPPPPTVPSYMGVIVASKITKKGTTISGNYGKVVVVKTDPGYAPGPLNQGTGKIVATFCP